MQGAVGGLDRLVTEQQRDYGAVDTVLQQLHRRGVTQHMGRDTLLPPRRAGGRRHCRMPGHHIDGAIGGTAPSVTSSSC